MHKRFPFASRRNVRSVDSDPSLLLLLLLLLYLRLLLLLLDSFLTELVYYLPYRWISKRKRETSLRINTRSIGRTERSESFLRGIRLNGTR